MGIGTAVGMAYQASASRDVANIQAGATREAAAAQREALQTMVNEQTRATILDSQNRLEAAKDHNSVMRTQIQQSTLVAKFQMMSFLAERLDSNSTALKIATQNAKLEMTRNKNEHIENIQALLNQRRAMDLREREIHEADSVRSSSLLA